MRRLAAAWGALALTACASGGGEGTRSGPEGAGEERVGEAQGEAAIGPEDAKLLDDCEAALRSYSSTSTFERASGRGSEVGHPARLLRLQRDDGTALSVAVVVLPEAGAARADLERRAAAIPAAPLPEEVPAGGALVRRWSSDGASGTLLATHGRVLLHMAGPLDEAETYARHVFAVVRAR